MGSPQQALGPRSLRAPQGGVQEEGEEYRGPSRPRGLRRGPLLPPPPSGWSGWAGTCIGSAKRKTSKEMNYNKHTGEQSDKP